MIQKQSTPRWCYPRGFRIQIVVDPGERERSYSAVKCELDFASALKSLGVEGRVDPWSLRLVRYDGRTGEPLVYDASADGPQQYEAPYRYTPGYDGCSLPCDDEHVQVSWLMRDDEDCFFSLYFDLAGSGTYQRPAYAAQIGDGDPLGQAAGPLLAGWPSQPVVIDWNRNDVSDLLCTMKQGDIFYFENRGSNAEPDFINRGPLRDAYGRVIRHYTTFISVGDWTGDGLPDLLVRDRKGLVHEYRNVGEPGRPVFQPRGVLKDRYGYTISVQEPWPLHQPQLPESGLPWGSYLYNSYSAPVIVDWEGNGQPDLLLPTPGGIYLYRNMRGERGEPLLEGTPYDRGYGHIFSRGCKLHDREGNPLRAFLVVPVDWDGDGLTDLIVSHTRWAGGGAGLEFLRNTGEWVDGRPTFEPARALQFEGGRVPKEIRAFTAADWEGDGRWHLFVNAGRRTLHFRDARAPGASGEPVLISCGTVEQKGAWLIAFQGHARQVDWASDGARDFVIGRGEGTVSYFCNLGDVEAPRFAVEHVLESERGPIVLSEGEEGTDPNNPQEGYARPCPVDWNGNGRIDLLVGSDLGNVYYLRNEGPGTDGIPLFRNMGRLKDSTGQDIRVHHRSCAWVADLEKQGRKDLLVSGTTAYKAEEEPGRDIRLFRDTGQRAAGGEPILSPGELLHSGDQVIGRDTDIGPLEVRLRHFMCDWDRDGEIELITYHVDAGELHIYQRTADDLDWAYDQSILFGDIVEGIATEVNPVDLRGTGEIGLLIGSENAVIRYVSESYLREHRAGDHVAATVQTVERLG